VRPGRNSEPGFLFRVLDGPGACVSRKRGRERLDELRVNKGIRISPVRLIDEEGEQVGIVTTEEARMLAIERGLDLVEVSPNARPPVCRLMDYGKYKYEAARKAREAKKKQHNVQVKELKLRPKIETHDLDFKLRHARRFLEEGDKVKFTMRFRGREITHPELGERVLNGVRDELGDISSVEASVAREGRSMTMVLAPLRRAE